MEDKLENNNRPTFIILIILCVVSFAVLASCSLPSVFNPDSYGKKWENTFVFFKPSNLDTLYISTYGEDLGEPSLNGIEYQVEWQETSEKHTVKITSYYHKVHAVHFSGFDEYQFWIEEEDTFTLTDTELLPMENGYYRLMLSEDLTK